MASSKQVQPSFLPTGCLNPLATLSTTKRKRLQQHQVRTFPYFLFPLGKKVSTQTNLRLVDAAFHRRIHAHANEFFRPAMNVLQGMSTDVPASRSFYEQNDGDGVHVPTDEIKICGHLSYHS